MVVQSLYVTPEIRQADMALVQKYFSFAEIIQGRDADVRVTEDGLFYAVDLVKVMTGFAI